MHIKTGNGLVRQALHRGELYPESILTKLKSFRVPATESKNMRLLPLHCAVAAPERRTWRRTNLLAWASKAVAAPQDPNVKSELNDYDWIKLAAGRAARFAL